jgi:hypothetical protein
MTVSVTFEPGWPRRSREPSKTDMSRVGFPSIARTKSPVWSPAFAADDPSRAAMTRRYYWRVSSSPTSPSGRDSPAATLLTCLVSR